jgi:hypothetical protein
MTRTAKIILLSAWALCMLSPRMNSQSNQEISSVELPRDLARVLVDYENAWQSHDGKKVAALFTDSGYVLSNGHEPIMDAQPLRGFMQVPAALSRCELSSSQDRGRLATSLEDIAGGEAILTLGNSPWHCEDREMPDG